MVSLGSLFVYASVWCLSMWWFSRMFSNVLFRPQIWDLENLLPLQLLNRHEGGVNSLVLYNDMLLSASDDHEIKVSPWISFTSWWRHQMETFSALLAICAGNSPVIGEFHAQRPVTRSFDVFFDLRLNKRLSKQWWSWWFLRRHLTHYDVTVKLIRNPAWVFYLWLALYARQKTSFHKGPVRHNSGDLFIASPNKYLFHVKLNNWTK